MGLRSNPIRFHERLAERGLVEYLEAVPRDRAALAAAVELPPATQ